MIAREADGNVVLPSGDSAIRFFRNWGGAPLEFWRNGFPGPITNRFPGSGVSVNFEVGQDPTQATANGITPNPICCFGIADSQQYNYYGREFVWSSDTYGICGFMPDFWLSAESADDYPCTPANGWSAINAALVFSGSPAHPSGIYCPGNEMELGQIRRYPRGKIAFKTRLAMKCPSGTAGFMFRKVVPQNAPTKDEFYAADGYHLNFNTSGQWQLLRQRTGIQASVANGVLNTLERAALLGDGLLIEIRTNNALPDALELYLNGEYRKAITLSAPILGDAFACFAMCGSGTIGFTERQIFDLGVQYWSKFTSLGAGNFKQTVEIKAFEPREFYRANTPGVFLNPELFGKDRFMSARIHGSGQWVETDFSHLFSDYAEYWCGNTDGTLGVVASELRAEIDGATSAGAHVLQARSGANSEFIMHLNPLPAEVKTRCQRIVSEVVWRFFR